MEINDIAAIGYAAATLAFAGLSALMLGRWRDRPRSGFVALASLGTATWACVQTIASISELQVPIILLIIEWIRNLSWSIALMSLLSGLDQSSILERLAIKRGIVILFLTVILTVYYATSSPQSTVTVGIVGGGVLLAGFNLILVEQIYRNAPFDVRSAIKYLCIGIGGIFIYDLIILSISVVGDDIQIAQWAARGFVTALFALVIGSAVQRSYRLRLDQHIPRQIAFFSLTLISIGVFIAVILLGDYYIARFTGTWAGVLRILLLVASVSAVAVLVVSSTIRARVRVFLMKSFFQYKYDYRKEWLRFISTLSNSEPEIVANTAVRAIAQIVNSPGGIIWAQEQRGQDYLPVGAWESELPILRSVDNASHLVRFLRQRQWVVDLNEMQEHPARYDGLVLEDWVAEHDEWWLIVPLLLGRRLFGFIVMEKPKVVPSLNFEDHDLLRTVGRHIATHVNQAESDRKLSESRQFGGYNRLTAFLMHDLNNLVAQQSLVVKNAEKFRHDPEFVDDTINTIAHSVSRMHRLLAQLSSGSTQSVRERTGLGDILLNATQRVKPRQPMPTLELSANDIMIEADPERLTTVIEHLIRNAQDATPEGGQIQITAAVEGTIATISIRDSGCGMSPDFIRDRLFRPFDSTKGSQSMGIGAYQAREYICGLGGQLDVTSIVGEGTEFLVRLPIMT